MRTMETADDLSASLAMTNNGYLFAPTAAELAVAVKYPALFSIRLGQIHRYGVACEHPAPPVKFDWKALDPYQPDYEGAILARQEKYMFD
jgi:hypothetical protein